MPFLFRDVADSCGSAFGSPDICIFSPGRANIIGEHTDYSQGYVMPFATKQGIYIAAKKIPGNNLEIISLDTTEKASLCLYSDNTREPTGWLKYIFQILKRLSLPPGLPGLGIVFGGDLPIGAGMSSSSSLTCGFLSLFNHIYSLQYSREKIIQLAVESEHGTGVKGGMM